MRTMIPAALTAALLASASPVLAQTPAAALGGPPPDPPGSPGPAIADAEAKKQPARIADLDLTIPEAPGFAVIGLTPTSVVDPAVSRLTLLDFIPYTDSEGNLKPGFALSALPYFWLQPGKTLADYRERTSPLERALARTQISVGFAEGGDGNPDRVGLGFTTELLGNADYRLNKKLYGCVEDTFHKYFNEDNAYNRDEQWAKAAEQVRQIVGEQAFDQAMSVAGPERARLRAQVNTQYVANVKALRDQYWGSVMSRAGPAFNADVQTCRDDFKQDYLNQAAWTVAGGFAWKSKGGGLDNSHFDGGSLWTSARVPLGKRKTPSKAVDEVGGPAPEGGALADDGGGVMPNYLTGFLRYDFDKKADIPNGVQEYDRFTAAVVGGYVWKSGMKFSVEGGYEKVEYRGKGPLQDSDAGFYAVTLIYPINKGAWIEAKGGASKSNPAAPSDKDSKVTVSFHWAPPAGQ